MRGFEGIMLEKRVSDGDMRWNESRCDNAELDIKRCEV